MSQLEDTLLLHIVAAKLPRPEREFAFAKPRRWRFDLCWPDRMLAAEVEGGSWIQGRHSRGAGMRNDCGKYNEAVLRGWRLLRVTADMVRDGSALEVIERALSAEIIQKL